MHAAKKKKREKRKKKREKRKREEAEHKSLWQKYKETRNNTNARECSPNQASKQLKPNWEPDRKDGENGKEKEGWKKIHSSHPIETRTW